ncbi:MAG: 2Fe-2S iron-sulfur cluster-binding protein [Polyangiales bacterium]
MAPRRIDARALPSTHPLARRLAAAPPPITVTLEHDGVAVTAHEGEPVALALAAAGHLTLARSPKYHRARGPSCLRGSCDGCLVRVDDTPGVMACHTAVRPGMVVRSQNSFPSARFDVLQVTDWFFPRHLDHHHLMTGFGAAINRTMQTFARQMAGIGSLPEQPGAVVPHAERDVDVLVVGAGSSGTAAADVLHAAGLSVLVVDEDDAPGGSARDRSDLAHAPAAPKAETLARAAAVATYDRATLVAHRGAVVLVRARARLFANGCHDTVGTFVRNDLPGIFTARAFSRALVRGVLLGERVVLVGDHPWHAALHDALTALGVEATRVGEVVEADGRNEVTAVTVRDGESTRTIDCDALVTGEVPAAAYELAGQAGAALGWETARRCFVPRADDDGATAQAGVYVAGTLRAPFATEAERAADGVRVARRIITDLGGAR